MVFWPKMLYISSSGDLVAGWRNVWADWAMHITQANAFYSQPIFEVFQNHPIYSGIPLSYPFVINLLSGLLMRLGVPLVEAFIVPSLLLSFILLFGLYYFGKTLTQSAKQTLLAITLFLTSGGLGFMYFFSDLQQDSSWQRILYPLHEYTHMKDIGYYWTTTLLAHLVPQRAFLLGMTVGVFILTYLYYHFKHSFSKTTPAKMFLLGLSTGLIAYMHNHTLIMLFLISAWLFVWSRSSWRHWFSYAFGTALTALPFFYYLGGPEFSQYVKWYPGWLANKQELDQPAWWFWFKNWGLFLPLFIVGFKATVKEYKDQVFIGGFIFLFFLANLFIFQPSSWDNAKLFLWVYLVFSFPVAGLLLKVWQRHFGKILTFLLFIILTTSGGLDLMRVLNTSKESFVMVSNEELKLAAEFRQQTTSNDLVLTSTNHLNWVPVAAGRRIVMGYPGWLWSHGIKYAQKEADIKKIYQGLPEAPTLLKKYGITYVVVDKKTEEEFGSTDYYFKLRYPLVYSSPFGNIYKVNH